MAGAALKGSQQARFYIAPKPRGCDFSHAEAAIALAEGYGLILDEWQKGVVRAWLRTTSTGLWAASTWGVSVPRQNGKNGALECVELYLLVVLGQNILHTSHLLTSARKAFKRLMSFFGRKVNDPNARFPELNALVKEIRKTNGQEAIELYPPCERSGPCRVPGCAHKGGGLIEVGARTGGAGRGSSFDLLVVDEAQEYEEDEQEALEPTISAAPGGDPVTIYMGTPPKDLGARGEPFVRIRNSAVSGANKGIAWVEHSAEGDVDLMDEATLALFVADPRNWAAANPALGIRVKVSTVEQEHARWSPRSFARERLNMWPTPVENGQRAFDMKKWAALIEEEPSEDWPVAAYGLDMNLERTKVSISVATFADDPTVHLEMAIDLPFAEAGTSSLVEWLWERCKRRIPVVIDGFSPAKDVVEVALKKRGVKTYILGAGESVQSFAMLMHAVHKEKSVSHFGQEHLDESMKHVVKDPIRGRPGAFRPNRDSLDADLAPTMATIAAHYGARKFARRRTGNRRSKSAISG